MTTQFGALPYRIDPERGLQLLLITSRERRRWIVPRGNPIGGLPPHEAAAREAFEEAGVAGTVDSEPLGSYTYRKRLRFGFARRLRVVVYPLRVERQLDRWPEERERVRLWLAPDVAADAVEEIGLKRLILAFRPAS